MNEVAELDLPLTYLSQEVTEPCDTFFSFQDNIRSVIFPKLFRGIWLGHGEALN